MEGHGRNRRTAMPLSHTRTQRHAHITTSLCLGLSLSLTRSLSFSLVLRSLRIRGKFGGALAGMHGLGVWVWVVSTVGSCGAREAGGAGKDTAELRRHASTVDRQHLSLTHTRTHTQTQPYLSQSLGLFLVLSLLAFVAVVWWQIMKRMKRRYGLDCFLTLGCCFVGKEVVSIVGSCGAREAGRAWKDAAATVERQCLTHTYTVLFYLQDGHGHGLPVPRFFVLWV